jgi:hypothetical protein
MTYFFQTTIFLFPTLKLLKRESLSQKRESLSQKRESLFEMRESLSQKLENVLQYEETVSFVTTLNLLATV